jgi:hypothetical protein
MGQEMRLTQGQAANTWEAYSPATQPTLAAPADGAIARSSAISSCRLCALLK